MFVYKVTFEEKCQWSMNICADDPEDAKEAACSTIDLFRPSLMYEYAKDDPVVTSVERINLFAKDKEEE